MSIPEHDGNEGWNGEVAPEPDAVNIETLVAQGLVGRRTTRVIDLGAPRVIDTGATRAVFVEHNPVYGLPKSRKAGTQY